MGYSFRIIAVLIRPANRETQFRWGILRANPSLPFAFTLLELPTIFAHYEKLEIGCKISHKNSVFKIYFEQILR